jgi:hypothetical protein
MAYASRTIAWGAAHTVIETENTDNVSRFRVRCTEERCEWHMNFVSYPGRGVSMDDIILEMNMHASKEH